MELFDVTVPLRAGMVVYPGDPPVRTELAASVERGDPANLTRLDFGVHSGTHVDAPVHFLPGAAGAERLALDALVGPAQVVDATELEGDVDEDAVAALEAGVERVLFKTRNSELWARDEFVEEFAKLTEGAARALVARGVRLVGIDYLSVGGPEAHVALLEAGVVPLEGVDLRAVEPGRYTVWCLPLKLVGSDGAPARVLLARD